MKNGRISTTRLAEICGVSQGTVDRALNGRKGISSVTREKILEAAKEYGYKPNIHARSIAGGRSMLIGVVIFDLYNQYFSELLMYIEKYCRDHGYAVVTMFSDKNKEQEIECIKELHHMSVDGIILCPVNSSSTYEKFLKSLQIPIVTVGNCLDNFPYVGINNEQAMGDTISYVLDHGYNRLYYVKPKLKEANISAQKSRLDTFCKVCLERDIEHYVLSLEDAIRQKDNMLHETANSCKKTAYICSSDIYAIRLLNIAKDYKIGIIGFDNLSLIDDLHLCLDSVAYDVYEVAKITVAYIIDQTKPNLDMPCMESQLVAHRIVKRGSV